MNTTLPRRQLFALTMLAIFGIHAGSWALEKKPLGNGELTIVKNSVQHVKGADKTPAAKGAMVAEGNKVEIGSGSCSEITFTDSSVMRLAQNSSFSFDSKKRLIRLEQGTVLMHVPFGNGGISIEGGGVVGEVTGSTVMASSDGKGNFTFSVLESESGSGRITNKDGSVTPLTPGQMGVVSANRPGVSTSFELNVTGLMESSPLFTEFTTPMPGNEKVVAVAEKQGEDIEAGVKVLEKTPNADDKSARVEDPAVEAFAALTGLPSEECAEAPNLVLVPFKGTEGAELTSGTIFTMNTDAGGEVSARVSSGNAEFVPTGSAAGVKIGSNQGFSSSTGQVASLPPTDNFTGNLTVVGDARSADGKSIAATSAQPSSGGPGDVATAAGSEAATDTAAGGGARTDTQSPLSPVLGPSTTGPTSPT